MVNLQFFYKMHHSELSKISVFTCDKILHLAAHESYYIFE